MSLVDAKLHLSSEYTRLYTGFLIKSGGITDGFLIKSGGMTVQPPAAYSPGGIFSTRTSYTIFFNADCVRDFFNADCVRDFLVRGLRTRSYFRSALRRYAIVIPRAQPVSKTNRVRSPCPRQTACEARVSKHGSAPSGTYVAPLSWRSILHSSFFILHFLHLSVVRATARVAPTVAIYKGLRAPCYSHSSS